MFTTRFNINQFSFLWHYLCILWGFQNKHQLFSHAVVNVAFVFITETCCVYCAVRNGLVYLIQVNLNLLRCYNACETGSSARLEIFRSKRLPANCILLSKFLTLTVLSKDYAGGKQTLHRITRMKLFIKTDKAKPTHIGKHKMLKSCNEVLTTV